MYLFGYVFQFLYYDSEQLRFVLVNTLLIIIFARSGDKAFEFERKKSSAINCCCLSKDIKVKIRFLTKTSPYSNNLLQRLRRLQILRLACPLHC